MQTVSGLFAGRLGIYAHVSCQHIGVLLFMLGAQRQVRLRRDVAELV